MAEFIRNTRETKDGIEATEREEYPFVNLKEKDDTAKYKKSPYGEVESLKVSGEDAHFTEVYVTKDGNEVVQRFKTTTDGIPMDEESFNFEVKDKYVILNEQDRLSKYIPNTEVIYDDSGAWQKQERVIGENFEPHEEVTTEDAEQLDDLLLGALEMYQFTSNDKRTLRPVMPEVITYDIDLKTFGLKDKPKLKGLMKGKLSREGGNSENIYCVDTYPIMEVSKMYLGMMREAVKDMKTEDGEVACQKTLAMIDQIGYIQPEYA